MSNIPVAIFVRVSRKLQSYDRQVSDLKEYAQRQGYQVIEVIFEKGSATKRRNTERPELEQLLQLCGFGKIKKVLVSEFSRLGRRRGETPALMESITELGVSVYVHNIGIETLMASGKRNPVAGIVMAAMFELDAMETERLSERILSGMEEAKRKGKVIGRPTGSKKKTEEFLKKYAPVVKDLKKGFSIRKTAAFREISVATVNRIKRAITATKI